MICPSAYNVVFGIIAKRSDMEAPKYTDVEKQEQQDEDDYNKMKSYHEMAQVHRLTRKVYFQCLLLMVLIGVLLLVFAVHAPYKDVAPMANDLMSIVGVSIFLVLSFFAFTCGGENAQTKLVLIILISIFLGLSAGFFMAMNITVTSKRAGAPYYNNADLLQLTNHHN